MHLYSQTWPEMSNISSSVTHNPSRWMMKKIHLPHLPLLWRMTLALEARADLSVAVNVFISALKLDCVLECVSLLEPASSGHWRNCNLWHFPTAFMTQGHYVITALYCLIKQRCTTKLYSCQTAISASCAPLGFCNLAACGTPAAAGLKAQVQKLRDSQIIQKELGTQQPISRE